MIFIRQHFTSILLGLSSVFCLMSCQYGQDQHYIVKPKHAEIIVTKSGHLQGVFDGEISVFKGIPYAVPPIGDNRWRRPQPVVPWRGIRSAVSMGNDCMQKPFLADAAPLTQTPSEDCLYLNVWAPESNQSDSAPVVVWLHGGGFVNGGTSPAIYDGSEFAKNGVVFVSVNYRLGRFGFFAHPALIAENGGEANYALYDQLAALRWVKNNITAFGGDPEKVTLMGESAGGRAIHLLMHTTQAQGLFSQVVVMSGAGRGNLTAAPLSHNKSQLGKKQGRSPLSAEQIGLNFAARYGIHGEGEKALLALRALTAEQVTDELNIMQLIIPPTGPKTFVGGAIGDTVLIHRENQYEQSSPVLIAVPMMIGTTSADLGFARFNDKAAVFASFENLADKARQAYDPDGDLSLEEVSYQVAQDRAQQEPARHIANTLTQLGQPVYLYRFGYVAENVRNGKGAPHASEVPFFFNTVGSKYPKATDMDHRAAELAFHYLVSFIKQGEPRAPSGDPWYAYSPDKNNILSFTMCAEATHQQDPWRDRLNVVFAQTTQ